jgi:1,4-dihydroxy-2-naphthoate octaprenyltransferase
MSSEENIKLSGTKTAPLPPTTVSPRQAWIMAARPKTLPAAAAPVIAGTAVAYATNNFNLLPALAALLGALLLQIGANFANDFQDFKKGADTAERLGPTRVTSAGLLTTRQVSNGMWLVFGLAMLDGLYLLTVGGWPIIAIGLASIVAAIAYTGGPFPLGYNGLGEVFVFIFFGLVAVVGTYYVQANTVTALAWWVAIPIGMLASGILAINNLRDLPTDRKVGKHTLAVRFGQAGARAEYFVLLAIAYLVPLIIWAIGLASFWVLLTWLSFALAWPLIQIVRTQEGRILNKVLGGTGRLELVYSILLALGLVIGTVLK